MHFKWHRVSIATREQMVATPLHACSKVSSKISVSVRVSVCKREKSVCFSFLGGWVGVGVDAHSATLLPSQLQGTAKNCKHGRLLKEEFDHKKHERRRSSRQSRAWLAAMFHMDFMA